MQFIRNILDKQKPLFEKGGKLERWYPAFEAFETFAFVPNHTAPAKGAHVRDAIDLKRMMMTVIIAMVPCLLFGIWNVGYQHYLALGQAASFVDMMIVGAIKVLPLVVISYGVGLGIEFGFAVMKGHSVNEGYLVSGMLIPLIMPVTVPLWQVALATAFAVVIGKEVFGGTGMNILNVAMTARAFLYFAYPVRMAGSTVWTYVPEGATVVNGYSGATALGVAAEKSKQLYDAKIAAIQANGTIPSIEGAIESSFATDWWAADMYSAWSMFIGTIPGSIGETSTLACLIGAAILIITGVGSWKIIVGGFAGAYALAAAFYALALYTDAGTAYMAIPPHYHLIMGGLAFGIVFMATDPVTATQTEKGKWIYGFLIGALTVLIRVFNPAYPEGIMLAVLLMNVFAPLIDYYIVGANKARRLKRLKLKAA
ncbi:NADH:ubiquinone reductase (Na(+)-transporting) subunit B [Eisenibacter elegans]|jgi:Na+-transporting NADH:ubiquinone oxidoreductase subunit B|uniref:NADH:ubiquinone reductase (Na(+)-transporting) subunit B n=1 Tax=Eisenibacter elegans TaxID=997 RepID=UPI0004222C74|nr:NADH:ubiquinone reductase (Na(+)-transporting) subunit B [Eisenibacter elegans]